MPTSQGVSGGKGRVSGLRSDLHALASCACCSGPFERHEQREKVITVASSSSCILKTTQSAGM